MVSILPIEKKCSSLILVFFPPVFPFLVREKAIETNTPRNNERASRVEREREKEIYYTEKRNGARFSTLSSKKRRAIRRRFHLFFLNFFFVIPIREACRFGKQKSIDPIISLLPKKKKKKKKKRKREKEREKTKERR